jgi:hypothetical protein
MLQEPPKERGRIGLSHLPYEISKRKKVWISVRKVSGLATDERTYLSRGANNDVIATDVKRRGGKMTRAINIDNQRDMETSERQARKIKWSRMFRQRGGGTILVGDFNAHSRRWDPRWKKQGEARFWGETIDEHGLEIGNVVQPTHHWARNGEEGESTIDLTIASRPIARWTILHGTHATDSDC